MPGIGAYARRVGDSAACLMICPAAPLIDAGMVVLAELGNFLNSENGSALLAKDGRVIKWAADDTFVAWIPYGWLPVHFAADFDDEAGISQLWVLPIWSGKLAKQVDEKTWTPIFKLNHEHATKFSGQDIWSKRLAVLNSLSDARKA